MADDFFELSGADRRDALAVAANGSGRPEHLLEKDVWVVWALAALFDAEFGARLVFKGGTSLSKAYQAIHRFSEDIDLTYDIRAIAPDLLPDNGKDALPQSRSQARKWSKEIRSRLADWVTKSALPVISEALSSADMPARAYAEGEEIYIDYSPLAEGTGYVRPVVLLEFGARSTGEPCETRPIVCDAAPHLPEVTFPTASPRVMCIERTFWEKATAAHVFCAGGRLRGLERFARHWHDIARLHEAGFADAALADRGIAQAVADHKSLFFVEKDEGGAVIDYHAAVSGALRLVPGGAALAALAEDYERMVEDGLLLEAAEPFEAMIERCAAVQDRANGL